MTIIRRKVAGVLCVISATLLFVVMIPVVAGTANLSYNKLYMLVLALGYFLAFIWIMGKSAYLILTNIDTSEKVSISPADISIRASLIFFSIIGAGSIGFANWLAEDPIITVLASLAVLSSFLAGCIFTYGNKVKSTYKGEGVANYVSKQDKNCPRCHSVQKGNAKICTQCGWEFIMI